MGSMPPQAGPPPGGDFSQMNQQIPPGYGQQPLPPPAKKSGIWIWVLGGCLGLLLLGGAVAAIIGYFAVQKAKEVSGDLQSRPVYTMAKALVMLNPDIELVDADEGTERITIREKSTGKTVSVSLEDLKEGKISFTNEKGEQFTLKTEGNENNGGIQIEGPGGKEVFRAQSGDNVEFPEWAPHPAGTYGNSAKTVTGDGTIWMATITSHQSVQDFAEQLERDVTSRGFKVTGKTLSTSSSGVALMFSATSADGKRTITATGGSRDDPSTAEFVFTVHERP
ncbi:MAG: hypothetical protein LC114_09775 [Bryobacterales bacterium]|nr:hypothetical protein [Bryobacterales bacterium]